jgi:putative chitinase
VNLSEHFTYEEMTRSDVALRKGIANVPDAETLARLTHTAQCMEGVRALLGVRIYVSSGFRSRKLNSAIGGAEPSQHCNGEAADFTAPDFGSPAEVATEIAASEIEFDQLILEGTWVHISFTETPRRSILTAHFSGGKATYTKGLPT